MVELSCRNSFVGTNTNFTTTAACTSTTNLDKNTASRSRQLSKALKVAIDRADIGRCKKIVENGASLNLGFSECQGCRPLLYALQNVPRSRVRYEIVEFLAMRGASIEGLSCGLSAPKGRSVLHYAAEFGYLELLHILLDKHPMAIFELRTTVHPIHLATEHGHLDCVEYLVYYHKQHSGK